MIHINIDLESVNNAAIKTKPYAIPYFCFLSFPLLQTLIR